MKLAALKQSTILRYALAVLGIVVATIILRSFQNRVNSTTVALTFLLFVLSSATFFGRNPALLASVVAMLCFNFFFLEPLYTWHIADPQNLVAWAAFTITAIIAGELSAYARRRANESERLFAELQAVFEKAAEAEALKRSERLKSALLDAVTHDLRTPLTSIKAAVSALLESRHGHRTIELDPDGESEFLEIINEETDRLNHFIEGMVDLAKIEAGSLGLQPQWSNITEILDAAISRVEGRLQNRTILIKIEKELPLVRADSSLLAEVVFTLLDNAAKYSPPGSGIEVEARRGGNDTIEVSVADEGEGIPEEWRAKIFDKFFRYEELGRVKPHGMGLGLAIARGIIEAHGGSIRVTDTISGKGAKFVVAVPIGNE